MAQPQNRSLYLALGRLRFAVVTSCWLIALCLVAQLLVWSLCTFTELRYASPEASGDVPLIVRGDDAGDGERAEGGNRRWRPESADSEDSARPLSRTDRVFRIVVRVSRTMGLMAALVIVPLLSIGLLLAVPSGAPRVERAVTALIWAIVLVMLAMPLGGWFGLAWQQGTISEYGQMVAEVEATHEEGFSTLFYSRFLLLPAASAVGFVLVGFHFSSAVAGVLMKRQVLDPELEAEAANVAATSLHSTGRTSGALNRALESDKKARKKPAAKASPSEPPKRLI